MTDNLFDMKEYDKIDDEGYNPFNDLDEPNTEEIKLHRIVVRRKLALRLALYINEIF